MTCRRAPHSELRHRSRLEDIGLDKKTADGVIKTIGSSNRQTLQQLKNFAAKAVKAGNDVKDKITEKVKPKGQVR